MVSLFILLSRIQLRFNSLWHAMFPLSACFSRTCLLVLSVRESRVSLSTSFSVPSTYRSVTLLRRSRLFISKPRLFCNRYSLVIKGPAVWYVRDDASALCSLFNGVSKYKMSSRRCLGRRHGCSIITNDLRQTLRRMDQQAKQYK